jgi:hypothetical protein
MPTYNQLLNPSENIVELIKEQNSSGAMNGKFMGWEPYEVLIAKAVINAAASSGILGQVLSVNGMVGFVNINKSTISLGNVQDVDTTNASNLTSGTIPNARFPATLPAVSGVNLTALNATNLTSGTISAARLPAFTGGDVTSPAGSTTLTISNSAVTYAKIQGVTAASRLLGRGSASGAGIMQELTLGSGLTLTGTVLSAIANGGVGYNSSSNVSGNTTVTPDSGSGIHTEITNISGSGSTTRIMILDTAGSPVEGCLIRHRLEVPATAAILIEWRSGASGGPLLTSYLTDSSGDDVFAEFIYTGSGWAFLNFTVPSNA